MMTIEEATEEIDNNTHYARMEGDFLASDAQSLVDGIFESVGTCQTCKKQATRDCPMVFFNQETYETVDHSKDDGFCSEFERKQDD